MTAPTEKRFEEYIETSLLSQGYSTIHYSEYDKQLCLIPDEVMTFLRESQPDPYKNLFPRQSKSTTMRVLKHISDEIEKHGLVEVLRKGVKVDGENLNLIYFQPNSGLNKDHEQLFKKNRFTLVRQLRYSQNNENALDLVLFINGLPVVTMELKSTLNNQTYKDAEKQYKTTRDPWDILFRFMRCIVHFCVDDDYVSMTTKLSGESTFFLPFNKGIENPNNLFGYKTSYLWEEVLTPESICDIIENFVHVAKETKTKWDNTKKKAVDSKSIVLVFPRYHQLEVIRKLKETIREEGAGHNYLIQHTTGSGKSYSIGWLAHLLTSLFQSKVDTTRMFDCVIVVTDRVVLDRQLQATIKQLEQTRGVVAGVEAGSKQLKQFLQSGKDIIITTIQKFPYISSEIAGMKNKKFAVIIDEVHSSQTGETAKHLKKALSSTGEIDEVENVEDKLLKEIESRGKQPHISYFGFTGTPKNKTLEIFGRRKEGGKFEAFHYYTMRQSIHEGFTLDVLQNYTTAKRYFKVVKKDAEDKEVPKEKAESAVLGFVDSHPETIKRKVEIILEQFRNKTQYKIKGQARAMVVVRSRLHCVLFFKEITRQMEEKGFGYSCLVAFSGAVVHNGEEFTEDLLNRGNRLAPGVSIAKGMKDPRFKIMIVSNKYQTGYDEPLMHTMFIDKPLDGIQCVQTLSRLNRTLKGKTDTFILDFVNKYEDIIRAFKPFYTTTVLSGETDKNKIYEIEKKIMQFNVFTKENVEQFAKEFYSDTASDEKFQPLLNSAVSKWNELKYAETKKKFKSEIQSYIRLYGYISQIITIDDNYYEKLFVYLQYLNRKLPKTGPIDLDIKNTIDLESLRIDLLRESSHSFDSKPGNVRPIGAEGRLKPDEPKELLSKIISIINKTYGVSLTEEDQVILKEVNESIQADDELRKFMIADNSEQNKKQKFTDFLNKALRRYVIHNLEFYKRIDNPGIRSILLDEIYRDYGRSGGRGYNG